MSSGPHDSPPVNASGDTPEPRDAIRVERVRLVFAQAPTALAVNVVLASVVVWLLWGLVTGSPLLAWAAAIAVVTAGRAYLVYGYGQRSPGAGSERVWLRWLGAGVIANGLVWGSLGPAFAGALELEYQLALALVLGGLTAGAVPALAPVLPIYIAFLLAALLPFTVWLLARGSDVYLAMGLMALVYIAATAMLARNYSKSLFRAIALAARNAELIDELSRSTSTAEAANRQLEAEIAERRQAQAALLESESRFKDFASMGADLLWETGPDLRYTRLAGRVHMSMVDAPEELIGVSRLKALEQWIPERAERERHIADLEARRPFNDVQLSHVKPDGKTVVLMSSGRPIFDENGAFLGYRGVARNITEAHRLAQELKFQATHDALTSLRNRRELEHRLERAIDNAHRDGSQHVLCYLDLDQFKVVNDTCGHPAGDELLRQISELFKRSLRSRDTLARLGGDEFALLLEHCSVDDAERAIGSLRKAVEEFRFAWEDQVFHIGVSAGIAPVTRDSGDVSQVMSAADSACYAAKERGRNRAHVYRADDLTLAKRSGEMRWVTQLTSALEAGRFRLYRQPIVRVSAKVPARSTVQVLAVSDEDPPSLPVPAGEHFEVLLRMVAEDGSLILPGAFLPAAERYGLSTRIDKWVVAAVLSWLAGDPQTLARLALCSINLSGNSLGDDEFAEFLGRSFAAHGVEPHKICLEIRETEATSKLGPARAFIAGLSALGCRFALDDFGSGLSSYGYLKNLPIHYLKIDGLFVKDMLQDPIDLAMVKSIVEIGKVTGKETIAEFVESVDILNALRAIGVDYVQGYGVGMPRPIEVTRPWHEATAERA